MEPNIVPQSQAEHALAARPQGGALALLAGGRAETAKALAHAISECHAVTKNAENSHHKYKYASADAIIEEGRKALAAAGLALVPIEASLNGSEREGPDRFELVRTFALLHTSGEITPLRVCWPVVPGNGRPLDKATAAADTSSLSYLLRDLLMMPRVDPSDDMNTRDDRPQPAKPPKPKQSLPANGEELQARLKAYEDKMVAAGRCKDGGIFAFVRQQCFPNKEKIFLSDWTQETIAKAMQAIQAFAKLHPASQPNAAPPASAPATNGHAPHHDAPGKLTLKQVVDMNALIIRKKADWRHILDIFALDPALERKDFPADKYGELMQALRDEPDPQPAAPARK